MGRPGSSMQLMRIAGIRIGVDASWFIVLFLAIFFLQDRFKDIVDGTDTTAYLAAVLAAFLFFASIVLHELGHAVAARRDGIGVSGIDLFFFGGLMKMSGDTQSPGSEFRVAVAGPIVTLLIVVAGIAVGVAFEGWDRFWEVALLSNDDRVGIGLLLVSFLVPMNLALLLFNLIPAFPLDGGRIARAAIWKATGDRAKATRASATVGRGFGWLLIGFGIFLAVRGNVFDGIWLAVLGYLLGQSAQGAIVQSAVTERLEGVTVADVMDSEPVWIPAALPVRQAYDEFFLRYHGWEWFAVVEEDGRYAGMASREAVRQLAEGPGADRPVREASETDADGRVAADAPLEALLGSDALRRRGALMAVDADGRLRGVVTFEQVTRALRTHLAPG